MQLIFASLFLKVTLGDHGELQTFKEVIEPAYEILMTTEAGTPLPNLKPFWYNWKDMWDDFYFKPKTVKTKK
jgi:hypothetical protein